MASPPTTQPEATPQPPTTTKPTPIITTSTPKTAKHYLSKTLPLYTKAFINDAMFVYPLQHIPWYDRSSSLYRLFAITGSVALSENVTIWESHTANPNDANDTHHCIALIVAPGQKLMNDLSAGTWIKVTKANGKMLFGLLRRAGVGRFLSSADEYYDWCKKAKAMVFAKDEQYYYVSHIATDEKHRGKGLAPALLRGVLAKAQEEGRPVWLEASSANSRKVYLKVGFTDVAGEEGMKTGVGKANAEGEYARGKEAVGVSFWPMVWWPEGYKHGKVKESG